jgi:hypothetical protein
VREVEVQSGEAAEGGRPKSEPKIAPKLPPWLKLIDPEEMKALEAAQLAMILRKQ